MATITMTDIEYQALLHGKIALEGQIADLHKQVDAARRADANDRVEYLVEMVQHARTVIGFCIAHLPPETVRGWPHAALHRFAEMMEKAPGVDAAGVEQAIDMRAFAREARTLEDERASRVDPLYRKGEVKAV
jgi:hypothetical protein